ncbi:MAG: hypothetical protein A4E64_00671 [Syntrophorhabdus sp. PtaU1.Bin058]|nr:MAG: hypothetical protein A4E64_00671 [Syntrophorhabdus sp. PtaU1.Bin058]
MSTDIVIIKDERVTALLDERHILDQDVKQVIAEAEATGVKLYQPDSERYLAKLQTANATFYVEYSPVPEGYQVHTAYFHKSEIVKE